MSDSNGRKNIYTEPLITGKTFCGQKRLDLSSMPMVRRSSGETHDPECQASRGTQLVFLPLREVCEPNRVFKVTGNAYNHIYTRYGGTKLA